MNSEARNKLRLKRNFIIHPSVAANYQDVCNEAVEGFNILSVGRFVPLKGFDLTIRAFAQFYKTLCESERALTKLTLVGNGPCKQLLEKMAFQEGIEKAITIIEWLPRDEVMKLYKSASVFLFPSHEGAGMVVPEAMSCGLPVVCIKNCGPGELVHPNSSLTVPYKSYPETIDQLAIKLTKLFIDKDYINHEIKLSKERYNNLFQWNVRGEMLKHVYDYVINKTENSISL